MNLKVEGFRPGMEVDRYSVMHRRAVCVHGDTEEALRLKRAADEYAIDRGCRNVGDTMVMPLIETDSSEETVKWVVYMHYLRLSKEEVRCVETIVDFSYEPPQLLDPGSRTAGELI